MFRLLLLLSVTRLVHPANILIVGVTVSHSHHLWIETVALGLVDRSHNVTFLSLDPTTVRRDNYTVITLEGIYDAFEFAYEPGWLQDYAFTPLSIPAFVDFYWGYIFEVCRHLVAHATLHNTLLSYPKAFKFDLILWDHTMGHCLYPLIARFGSAPTVGLSPYGLSNEVEWIYGGHVYSYVGQLNMPFVRAATLWQRFVNICYINFHNWRRETSFKPKIIALSRAVFPDWDRERFERVEEQFNLALVNWHVAANEAQALSPNLIPVGGVHISDGARLPEDVAAIYAQASSGVVFFSLGSNTKSESLALPILQLFADCFADLRDLRVIWKIQPPAALTLPPNVNAVSWAPQSAILAQPKTRLFITHGGALSIHESFYFGVPIVGVPIFLDQTNNIEKLRMRGGGELVRITEMLRSNRSSNVFCDKVKRVLFTESYARNMRRWAQRYRDREAHPLAVALHWVEYVLRNGDAKHLSPLSRYTGAFYTQNLDVYLVLAACLVLPGFLAWTVLRRCCRWFYGSHVKEKTA